jgi:hypothetical protein
MSNKSTFRAASKHPSTASIEAMDYMVISPSEARGLAKAVLERITMCIYNETSIKKSWIDDAFAADSTAQFLICNNTRKFPKESMVLAVCPNGSYYAAFFINVLTGKTDYLNNVEQENRRPFTESANEKAERLAQRRERAKLKKMPPVEQQKHEQMQHVRDVVGAEGFEYAFRHYSSFKDVSDKKFHELREAFCNAADALEEYIKS